MMTEHYRDIIAACFPELAINTCEFVSQGWDSVAVVVDGELIFRFPKRPDVEPQYRMEALLLEALAGRVALPLPRFAYVWDGRPPYRQVFVGYRMLAGEQLRPGLLAALGRAGIAAQLGGFLSDLHGFPVEQAARCGVQGGDAAQWRLRYRNQYADVQARVLPLLDADARARVARRWAGFLEHDANFRFRPALAHCDLSGDHILVDPAGGTVSGIIDWGDAAIGDPALDFTGLLDDYGAGFAELALAAYRREVDPTFRERMAFYRFVMPFNEILFGLRTGLQPHVDAGLAQLRAALPR
ncbi:MAG: phosphotransferase [Kouleothrix sp.]|nr:phosphotransferase [Kouleothrix sp.]